MSIEIPPKEQSGEMFDYIVSTMPIGSQEAIVINTDEIPLVIIIPSDDETNIFSKKGVYFFMDEELAVNSLKINNFSFASLGESYDDTEVRDLIKAISDDYLKSSDKYDDTEIKELINTKMADALLSANEYTDTATSGLAEEFENVIYQMYGNDFAVDEETGTVPTIRGIANDEADTVLTEAKEYSDNAINDLAIDFANSLIGMYGDDYNKETATVPTIREVANDEANTALASAKSYTDTAMNGKANAAHNHDDRYYTETEIDTKLSGKSDSTHNHDSNYDEKGAASNALASAKSYTDTKTSSLASTTVVDNKISTHNTSASAHSDIRDLISGLTTRLNTLANSDDTTLDQMSEIVAYIKNNKSLIDGVTTSKVNVADIVNNLTTNATNKPLSAAQGVAIKALIDALQSELDSHTHSISDVSGLQSALDGKAASSHGTHVSYSSTVPVMDGTASAGSASTVARSDHKHPTDTSRASKTEFDTHNSDTTKHITATERTNWNAAKTHADTAHAPSNAEKNQNAFSNIAVSGQTTVAADTATDTVTFVGSNVTITTDATNDKVTFAVADGSTSAKGLVQLTNSTSSTSTTTAATPNSVKSAYDLANTAKTNAATAQTRADSAYDLANSKANASHTHAISDVTNLQSALDGKANTNHNHKTLTFTGAATNTYDGSSEQTINIFGRAGTGTKAELFNSAAVASGDYSHAEGNGTKASGSSSHAEGVNTTASGSSSHAEGNSTTASGGYSHAEGCHTTASKSASHSEGWKTNASGHYSHAEGYETTSFGDQSHAEGLGTIANRASQHVEGKYNVTDTKGSNERQRGKYVHIVGNGTSDTERSNAHTLDWDGNAWYAGDIRVGGTSYDDGDEVALKSELNVVSNLVGDTAVSTQISTAIANKADSVHNHTTLDGVQEIRNASGTIQVNSDKLNLFANSVVLKNNPYDDFDAATKIYVDTSISSHNSNASAHADIRNQISQLSSDIAAINRDGIIQEVIAALQTPVFGRVDEDNNIIITGNLVDGTYTLKYEDSDGVLTEIGTLSFDSDEPLYTNQIPISTDVNGDVLNGTGYQAASRISTSSGTTSSITNSAAANAAFTTGFIPVHNGAVVRLKNCWMDTANLEDSASPYGHRTWALHVAFYDAMDTTIKKNVAWTDISTSNLITPTIGDNGHITQFVVNVNHPYMRLNLAASDPSQAILTIDETIT